jgi:2-(1,2-epoxy-1,2-dihydrophenyl)acetyl-CoA isomerase
VVPRAELEAEALAAARALAAGPTVALIEIRRLLIGSGERTLAEGLAAEHEAMIRTGGTSDAREGIAAFVERRAPRFTGS